MLLSLALSLFLCACSGEQASVQTGLDFRTKLIAAGGCSFTADVITNQGDSAFTFTAGCTYDGEDGTITVTAPEEISGISAVTDGETGALSYDGLLLSLGKLGDGRVAPMALPWLLGSAWKSDYISAGSRDGDAVRISYLQGYDDDELQIDTWFSGGVPIAAEVAYKGERLLSVTIHDFTFTD